MHVHVHTHIHSHAHAHTHVYKHKHTNAHTHTYKHTHTLTYTCTYTHRQTHVHVHTPPARPRTPTGACTSTCVRAHIHLGTGTHTTSPLPRPAGCCQAPVCPHGVRERLSTPGHTPGLLVPGGGTLSPQGDVPQFRDTNCHFGAATENWGTHSTWHKVPVPLGLGTWWDSGDSGKWLSSSAHSTGQECPWLNDNSGQAQGRGQQCHCKARAAPGR